VVGFTPCSELHPGTIKRRLDEKKSKNEWLPGWLGGSAVKTLGSTKDNIKGEPPTNRKESFGLERKSGWPPY